MTPSQAGTPPADFHPRENAARIPAVVVREPDHRPARRLDTDVACAGKPPARAHPFDRQTLPVRRQDRCETIVFVLVHDDQLQIGTGLRSKRSDEALDLGHPPDRCEHRQKRISLRRPMCSTRANELAHHVPHAAQTSRHAPNVPAASARHVVHCAPRARDQDESHSGIQEEHLPVRRCPHKLQQIEVVIDLTIRNLVHPVARHRRLIVPHAQTWIHDYAAFRRAQCETYRSSP